jgi:hypothetical protein
MALRKSDKIIAIVGVIILIVAGIGIFLYMDIEDDNGNGNGDTGKMKDYPVESKMTFTPLIEKSQSKIKLKVRGGADFSYNGELIGVSNLKNISVTLKYTDENPGLLGRFTKIGADTITISVVDSEKEKVGGGSKKGSGKITFDISGPAMEIKGPIEAESYEEAEQMLKDMYVSTSETYKFKINVKGGLFGALRERFLGKDSFKLTVTYCTYSYTLGEPMDDDGGNPNTETNFDPPVYHTTNFPGFH